jgi:Ca2+-binding RTX toxin-like protein
MNPRRHVVARLFNGTNFNDAFSGDLLDINIFAGLGIGSDKAVGGMRNDMFQMLVDRSVDFVDGGAGRDTIDYSRSSSALTINLASGTTTASFNLLQNVTVTQMQNIEDVVGSRFGDTIIGSTGANRLDGGGGNDVIRAGAGNDTLIGGAGDNTLDGGAGIDTADYSSANHSIYASLNANFAFQTDFTTFEQFGEDTLSSIENLEGSRFDDFLQGNSSVNIINGGDGNDGLSGMGGADTIHGNDGDDGISVSVFGDTATARFFGDAGNDQLSGAAGNDVLDGGTGNDNLFGAQGDDTLIGGDGNDRLEGSVGADTMAGGAGIDTVVYRFSQGGVNVNLANQTATGGDATGDTFSSVANVWGSQTQNDVLVGSSGSNAFFEQGGNNVLTGNGGRDTFAFNLFNGGSNIVTDFTVGNDRLVFVNEGSLADVNFSQTANGTLVTFDDHAGSILLAGVNVIDLAQNAQTDIMFTTSLEPVFGF